MVGAGTFLESFAEVLPGPDLVLHCQREHTPARYREMLASPTARAWLVELRPGGAPVGYTFLDRAKLPLEDLAPTDFEIKRVYVFGQYQGGGLGRRLVERSREDALELGATRLLLGVYAQNHAAIGFYKRMGFRTCGHRRFQVGLLTCDDLIMGMEVR
jgi:ribosomal protein S18 acetylase RimI-like enzyme